MFPQTIKVLGLELVLVKQRGKNNRAYRLETSDGHTDFTFREDINEDPDSVLKQIEETVRLYVKNEGTR